MITDSIWLSNGKNGVTCGETARDRHNHLNQRNRQSDGPGSIHAYGDDDTTDTSELMPFNNQR